jgi:dCMP deaminase
MRNSSSWDDTFMLMAEALALRSKDPVHTVGCLLVNPDKRIAGAGYNGMPPGLKETPELWTKENKKNRVVHAEMNALLFAGKLEPGFTAYVTLHPCVNCALALITKQVGKIIYKNHKDYPEAASLLKEAGVVVSKFGE